MRGNFSMPDSSHFLIQFKVLMHPPYRKKKVFFFYDERRFKNTLEKTGCSSGYYQ
jgi:hypothetical protein